MRLTLIALAALSVAACGEPAPDPTEVPPTADAPPAFEPTATPDGNNLAPALETGGDANPANAGSEPGEPPANP